MCIILFFGQVTSINGVPGLKAAMDQYGYYGGPPREPLLPVDGPTLERILKAFADNGF
jgi:4-hydroxy-2-oxoglutarate aldolase